MSTFENDLRLEEIGTGERSGTWGTATNTNLELIANALSYSVTGEAIANASTHTITMQDGVADEVRSFYLKCTGGGQACTVTLAPNTLSKVWMIENTTSATLTFSQGSGANVAILAGQVKVIGTDGAGSGAAVFDLMQDLAVPDLFVDDDLTLQSDAAVLGFGADKDVTLTHVADTGLLLNAAMKVQFRDAAIFIGSSGADVLDIASDGDINLTATADINIPANVGLTFGNDGEKIEGDGTDLTIAGNNINLTAVADVVIPANVGLTFGTGEKIEGDSTDLTITSGAKINLTATSDIVVPADVGITFGTGEKIEGDNTDLTVTSGADINLTATADVNIPSGVGLTFGDDGEKIEGDGTDLTITGNNINLTATADVVIPANVGITFGTGEKIEGDSTDLTVTSGADINLTATADINIPADVGLTFGNDGEKIEGDGTDLTISGNNINLTAVADIVVPANVGITFGTGEKIEGDSTDLTITSGAKINLAATTDVHLANNIGMVFGDAGEKIEGDGTNLAINSSGDVNITATTVDLDGNLEVSGTITLGSGAVISEAELELLDGLTPGTAIASKVVTTDANIDTTGQRNLTITGELDAATGDFSGIVDVAGVLTVSNTTASSSSTTGSLIVGGGAGIADDLYVGDDLAVTGLATIGETLAVTGVLTTTATQVATGGITSGSNIVSDTDSTDDLGTTGTRWANLFVDAITATDQITATGFTGTLDGVLGSGSAAAATVTTLNTSDAVNLNLTTDSTSSTSGALIVDGGVGIAKKLFVGTDFDVTGNAVIDGTALVTGQLTTTAATVFNGGFSTKAAGTIQHTDGVANVSLTPTATGGVVNVRDDSGTSVIALDGRDSSVAITGVLTTTAAAVFNGGFTSNADTSTFASANAQDPVVIIKNTTNDSSGARLHFVKDRGAAGTDGSDLGEIDFIGDNDAQQQTLFGRIEGLIGDASDGAEGGRIRMLVATHDGEMQTGFEISDGNAEDEIDVSIGKGGNSATQVAGRLGLENVGPEGVLSIPSTNSATPRIRFQHPSVTGDAAIDTFQDGGGIYLSIGQNAYFASNGAQEKFNSGEEANQWYFDPSGVIVGFTATAAGGLIERMRVTSTAGANLRVSDGIDILDGNVKVASGHGIDFSATGDAGGATAELLDDYEEGAWTPVMTGSAGSAGSASTTGTAKYTRIGNLVTVLCSIRWANVGSYSGNAAITGLPYTSADNSVRTAGSIDFLKRVELVDTFNYSGNIVGNASVVQISRITSDASVKSQAQVSAFNDNLNEIIFSCSYNVT